MKIGLDLGVASIGWTVLKNESIQNEILGMGSRVIPLDKDSKDQFSKGEKQTLNANRTLLRSMRKCNFRYKLRREWLAEALPNKMRPNAELFGLNALELYGLRARAVTERIELTELGRILYHLNQKRGYKSSRKSKAKGDETSEYLKSISQREAELGERTIGQYIFQELQKNPRFEIKKKIFNRERYIAEFDQIWNTQKQHHQLLTDELKTRLRDDTIYFQRNLKSQKHLVGGCQFEKRTFTKDGKVVSEPIKVCPISSPLFQEFRIWQTINHLDIQEILTKKKYPLDDSHRQIVFDLFQNKQKVSANDILKALKLSKETWRTNLRKEVPGNTTRVAIKNSLEKTTLSADAIQALLVFDSAGELEKQPLFKLWHVLYSIDAPAATLLVLQKHFLLDSRQAETILQTELKEGFGSLSSKAIKKLLKYLRIGLNYADSCSQVGYNHSDSLTKKGNENRTLKSVDELELLKKGELRNPAVEKILNQMILLIKELVTEFGQPDEIIIELARELRQNAEQRNRTLKNIEEQERRNEKIRAELQKDPYFTGKRVSRRDIEKYKLAEEFNFRSPYRPEGPQISIKELFTEYEIEHIIPRARMFDDSFTNKTIAHVSDNREKDNDTAFDFMSSKRSTLLEAYRGFLLTRSKAKDGISKVKMERLLMSKSDIPDDFINRQLKETQFITKKAREILFPICREVNVTSGSVTSMLRHLWGFDTIIQNLHLPNYRAAGLTEVYISKEEYQDRKRERIVDWDKRNDHRHHALDALVVACTTRKQIKSLNDLNKEFDAHSVPNTDSVWKSLKKRFPTPFTHQQIEEAIEQILISYKPGKRLASKSKNKIGDVRKGSAHLIPRGRLHEESLYGRIKRYKKVLIAKLRATDLPRIAHEHDYNLIHEHLQSFDGDFKKAFAKTEREKLQKKGKVLETIALFDHKFTIRRQLESLTAKQIDQIVDSRVRALVKARVDQFNGNIKKAFTDLTKEENKLWLNPQTGLFIKSVICTTGASELFEIRPGTFVESGRNCHVALYRSENGLEEEVVTFFEAFERKRQGLQVIPKIHPQLGTLEVSMRENEMFVFDLTREALEEAIAKKNHSLISKHLFRVRKLTSGSYWFNHHLETIPRETLVDKRMNLCKQASRATFEKGNIHKVVISRTGKITLEKQTRH